MSIDLPTLVANAQRGDEFHYAPACRLTIGPKGGVHSHYEVWRCNGRLQTTNSLSGPTWRLPLKHGLRSFAYMDNSNCHLFHRASSCPKTPLP